MMWYTRSALRQLILITLAARLTGTSKGKYLFIIVYKRRKSSNVCHPEDFARVGTPRQQVMAPRRHVPLSGVLEGFSYPWY